MSDNRYRLSADQVRRYLPHRYPFLMIDRVLEIHPAGDLTDLTFDHRKEGVRVVAVKNVTYNEPYFTGHFPEFAIVPGVLLLESMAQAASFSIYPYIEQDIEKISRDFQCILVGVDHARFRRPVVPGDALRIESRVTKCRGKLWGFYVEASVDGQKVAEAEILANLLLKAEGI